MLPTIPAERLRLHIEAWLHDGNSLVRTRPRRAHFRASLREILAGQRAVVRFATADAIITRGSATLALGLLPPPGFRRHLRARPSGEGLDLRLRWP